MIRQPASIQGRLLAVVLGAVAGAWLLVAASTWFDARHELDELLDSHLAQAAALLVAQEVRDVEDDRHGHGVDAPILHRYAPKVAFQVFHEGRLVLRSANAPATPMIAQAESFRSGFATVRTDGAAWRVFATHGAEKDVQVYVGERMDSRASILKAVLRGMLWPMILALPLLALATWWGVRFGVLPLRRLGAALAERRPEALHPVAIDGIPSEMQPMVRALNGLFERIGGLLESERRFTADAAHELRTPIAAIRTQAQVALQESDDALRRHALLGTLEGCDRATRLVEQLLTLSRLEADQASQKAAVDLSRIAKQVTAELAPKAIAKHQALEFSDGQSCEVLGNEVLLAVLVRNLVDNAIRYSPSGATVRVAVQSGADSFALRVEDSGPGMPEAERKRLGERFFRVAGSGESGSGLGWSIVRRIAAAHQFNLEIGQSDDLGGLAVILAGKAAVAS